LRESVQGHLACLLPSDIDIHAIVCLALACSFTIALEIVNRCFDV